MITNLMKKMNNKKKKSGFTLIELIIVIAIIAILAMIALPKFMEIKENANVKADISNGKEIQSAVLAQINDDKITTYNVTDQKVVSGASGDPGKVVSYLQGDPPTAKSKEVKNGNFSYDISANGDVTVYAYKDSVKKEVYPKCELE